MHDAAVEQIGDGGKPDMGMRAHVDALPGDELHRSHLVEEDERADHLPLAMRQRAAHLEAAEVAGARHDDELQRVAGLLVAEDRVARWLPAHVDAPAWRAGAFIHLGHSAAKGAGGACVTAQCGHASRIWSLGGPKSLLEYSAGGCSA